MIAAFFTGLWARWIAPFLLPIVVGIAAAALLGFVVQTTRIEGLKILFFKIVGFKEEVSTLKLDLDNIKNAQTRAAEAAAKAKAETEAKYREAAERTDAQYEEELTRARGAVAAYVARNRVRPQAAGRPSGSAPTASQGDPPEGTDGRSAASPLVAIPADELDQLAQAAIRLKSLKGWGDDLIAKGLAENSTSAGTADSAPR